MSGISFLFQLNRLRTVTVSVMGVCDVDNLLFFQYLFPEPAGKVFEDRIPG